MLSPFPPTVTPSRPWGFRINGLLSGSAAADCSAGGKQMMPTALGPWPSPRAGLLAVGSNDGLRLWDARGDDSFANSRAAGREPTASRFRPMAAAWPPRRDSAERLICGTLRRESGLLSSRHPDRVGPDNPPGSPMSPDGFLCVAFSADGRLLAAGSRSSAPRRPGAGSSRARRTLYGCTPVARRSGGATRSTSSTAAGYGAGNWPGRRAAELEGHALPVSAIQFTRDGRLVSSAGMALSGCGTCQAVGGLGNQAVRRSLQATAAFAADHRHAFLSSPGRLTLVDLDDGARFASSRSGESAQLVPGGGVCGRPLGRHRRPRSIPPLGHDDRPGCLPLRPPQ
jgi:hypothetical protein